MQGGVLGLGQRGVHGEVRLFAVHGHHLGERLQLKCKERKVGKRLQELQNSHRRTVILCLSSNDAAELAV